jgi:hypothetical protein
MKKILLIAAVGLLAFSLQPSALSQVTSPRTYLLATSALTNAQTLTLNINTNIFTGGVPGADYITLWATSQCTNSTAVAGNSTITWKFAWDAPVGTNTIGTNFQGGGTLVFVNNGTTVVNSYTNIPAIWYRGANGFQYTSITGGQTNGGGGTVLTGQKASVYLIQPK